MKIVSGVNYVRIAAADMAIGDVGVIDGGTYTNMHVLRTYQGWVMLENPKTTWLSPVFSVRLLPIGTQLTMTIE